MAFEEHHVIELMTYTLPLLVASVVLMKLYPARPIVSFFVTTTMASFSHYHYWTQTWDLSHESLRHAADPGVPESVMLLCFAYMLADLPIQLFMGTYQTHERVMYSIHHISAAVSLWASIEYQDYGRLMVFLITSEGTNFLLNMRKLIDHKTASMVIDVLFAVSFFGYRMYYLFPVLCREMYLLIIEQQWFDLFIINMGPLFIGALHLYWSKLIIDGIIGVIIPPKRKPKSA